MKTIARRQLWEQIARENNAPGVTTCEEIWECACRLLVQRLVSAEEATDIGSLIRLSSKCLSEQLIETEEGSLFLVPPHVTLVAERMSSDAITDERLARLVAQELSLSQSLCSHFFHLFSEVTVQLLTPDHAIDLGRLGTLCNEGDTWLLAPHEALYQRLNAPFQVFRPTLLQQQEAGEGLPIARFATPEAWEASLTQPIVVALPTPPQLADTPPSIPMVMGTDVSEPSTSTEDSMTHEDVPLPLAALPTIPPPLPAAALAQIQSEAKNRQRASLRLWGWISLPVLIVAIALVLLFVF